MIEQRAELTETVGAAEMAVAVERLAEQVLRQLETNPTTMQCGPAVEPPSTHITGWPALARRAV